MTQAVAEKEYEKLLVQREKVARGLRNLMKQFVPQKRGNELLRIAELNLRGGPHDLSKRLDYYLYS